MQQIHNQVVEIAKEAAYLAKRLRNQYTIVDFTEKEKRSLVTHIDTEIENFLIPKLQKLLPEASVLAEESSNSISIDSEYLWVIDPIDGTTNLIYGIPPYSISIGLLHNSKPVVGVVYEITHSECFSAWKGGGAYLNGAPIHVHSCNSLEDAIIATGFPYNLGDRPNDYLQLLVHFVQTTRGLRRLGAASVDLAYLAAGRFSGYYEINLSPWDIAAGICIVEEAGGIVSDFNGEKNPVFKPSILATCDGIYDSLLKEIQSRFQYKA